MLLDLESVEEKKTIIPKGKKIKELILKLIDLCFP